MDQNEIALKRMLGELEQRAITAEASLVAATNSVAARDRDISRLQSEVAALKAAPATPAAPVQQSPPPAANAELERELKQVRAKVAELTQENEALKAARTPHTAHAISAL